MCIMNMFCMTAAASVVVLSSLFSLPTMAQVNPAGAAGNEARTATITNVMIPRDEKGNKLEAHGGSIIQVRDRWYWFGEVPRFRNWYFQGVACYSSDDLQHWRNEGLALPAADTGPFSREKVAYRPKVLYNDRTRKFVMVVSECNGDFSDGHLNFAVSDAITGPYQFAGSCHGFGGKRVMDMTVFKDDDGQAYVFYSANTDRTGHWVDKLADDYLSITSNISHPSTNDREAPCVFKSGGRYFLYFSECTGWAPNQGRYVSATSLAGPWTAEAKFGDATTYNSQGACIFEVHGPSGTTVVYVADQWNATRAPGPDFGDPMDMRRSNYIWLPIKVNGDTMSLDYFSKWYLDLNSGAWSDRAR